MNWPLCATVFFLGNVLLWADRSNFSVATAVWSKQFAWSPSTIGTMLSAFSLGYLVMQPIGGWIADRLGPRRTIAGTMAGWSLAVLLTPLSPGNLGITAGFRVLLGMFEGPYIPASASAVSNAVPLNQRRGRFSAFMQSGAQLGPAVGVFIAGMIIKATGSPAAIFITFGVFGFACAALWWLYARRLDDPMPTELQAQTEEGKARAAQVAVPWIKLLTTKSLWPLYIGYFALPYCTYIFLAWLPQYLTHYRGMSVVQASVVSSYPFLVAFVTANLTGWAMDFLAVRGWTQGSFHRKFFIAMGAAIYAVSTFIAATTASTILAVWMIVVASAALSFYVQPFWTLVTDMTSRQSGSLSGLMNFFGIIGATLSPFLSGVIAGVTGAFVAPLELAVVIMVVAATVAVLFVRVRPLEELVAGGMPGAARGARPAGA
jgi:ACS family glucarate transporter-like MFS transporter